MEQHEAITIDVWLDGKTYKRFSVFDTILRGRRWVRPLVFAVIFCVLAAICIIFKARLSQAVLLAAVLLAVGLGLPAAYFATYFITLNQKVDKLKIKSQKRRAYSLCLTEQPDGIQVVTPKGDSSRFIWKKAFAAYSRKDAIYLYVEAGKAYIIPRECAKEEWEAVWRLIAKMMPKEKLRQG